MARRGGTRRGGITSEIEKSLKGMNFPANRQDLVQQAKKNNASRDVVKAIQNLPEDRFNSPTDVAKAWGEERRGEHTERSSGTRRGGITSEIEKSLKGINFPASRQDLVQQAKKNNASRDVVKAIQNLTEDKFKSPTDVAKAWGEERRGM
ncbi:DUF2795 domain-containing protein [Methanobacterium sp. MBAC-LM]|uniref:DUF2795 domain-containing protein n=1 Tax=Methanobacterium sp. MBAC-LM TaxID=3412034 RepID=UPI003C734CBE